MIIYGKVLSSAKYLLTKCSTCCNISKNRTNVLISKKNIYTSESGKKNANPAVELRATYKRDKIPAGGYLLLIIPVSTFFLGVWQVYRWRWKLNLIDVMENKVYSDVSEFPFADTLALENMEYKKVKVSGHFDYSKEVLLGPRSLLQAGDSQPKGLISRSTNTGYHVVTPFKLNGHDFTILINRGWIPDRKPKKYKSTTEPVEIVGVVRKTENRAPFMGKNIPRHGLWLSRDIPSMAEYLGTDEIYLDLHSIVGLNLDNTGETKAPIPGQTRVTLRNEHVSYFCTWFSLSTITAYMWHRRFILLKPLL